MKPQVFGSDLNKKGATKVPEGVLLHDFDLGYSRFEWIEND